MLESEANRMGKRRVEKQKLGNAIAPDIRSVDFAIGFEGRAGAEQHEPIEMTGRGSGARRLPEMKVQQSAHELRALDVAAELNEGATLAIARGRLGRAFEH